MGMLIYGAFNPPQRPLVLVVAGASKVSLIALVLPEGTRYLSPRASEPRWFGSFLPLVLVQEALGFLGDRPVLCLVRQFLWTVERAWPHLLQSLACGGDEVGFTRRLRRLTHRLIPVLVTVYVGMVRLGIGECIA